MKTEVKIIQITPDTNIDGLSIGDTGYINGYCRGGDGIPYACVVVKNKIVMVSLHCLKVINNNY